MLYYQTINARTLECLRFLQALPELMSTRLVGGTALALQQGHRISIDIDLFGKIDCDALQLQELFTAFGKTILLRDAKSVHTFLIEGIKIDIVNYKYEWIEEPLVVDEIKMASLKDIGAMKLAAITGRGSKKDFYDIFVIMKFFSLSDLIQFYKQKYPDGSPFLVLKSLVYFEDAENDSLEKVFNMPTWDIIKKTIVKAHRIFIEANE